MYYNILAERVRYFKENEEGIQTMCKAMEDRIVAERNEEKVNNTEYSRAVTPQIRQAGNRLSGLAETAYASLLA